MLQLHHVEDFAHKFQVKTKKQEVQITVYTLKEKDQRY